MTSSDSSLDIDAYFERIGYRGPCDSTLETLRSLHRLHPQAIAFENLDPLLRRPVALDPAALERKLVRGDRGGYCFEHNLHFWRVLTALGFRASGLAGRVIWNRPEDTITPRGHMLLRVELGDGTYIADVGFGGLTLTAPLRLDPGREQPTPHEPFRITRLGNDLKLQAKIDGAWKALYRFDLQEQFQIDYEVANHYLSTHPASHFLNTLVAARPTAEGRYALLNNRLTVHRTDGTSESRGLRNADELRETLEGLFGIMLPDRAAFDHAWARLNAAGRPSD